MVLLSAKLSTWLLDSTELTVPTGEISNGFSGDLGSSSYGPHVLFEEFGRVGILGARGGMGGSEAEACTLTSIGVLGENEGMECSLGDAIGDRILKLS